MEIWKKVKGYSDYEVSSEGRVRSLKRGKTRYLKQTPVSKGYLSVTLFKNGKRKKITVHRVVALNFLKTKKGKEQVNHKNGIKTDNRAENLEWCNSSENIQHAYDNNVRESQKGSQHGRAKLTEEQVIKIRALDEIGFQSSIVAERYNVSRKTIKNIVNRKTWRHIP